MVVHANGAAVARRGDVVRSSGALAVDWCYQAGSLMVGCSRLWLAGMVLTWCCHGRGIRWYACG